ncbi:hypothetical protein POF50_021515 [Streptomyces sp. SL13]|uniref:Uncharacterized protein n=1 Tax=Streptantibioticus silvisoli TaxID=2705255 RepID=A0AA90KHI8_9ACTN|nr:hypothetical protein [Streptantibioticus silvisoli]MDI5971880.1 hypothetical protein [Streptantibioticus silvisoli]
MDRIGITARAITCFHAPQTCTTCGGSGGSSTTETSGGVTRSYWQNCAACGGSGQR